MAESTIKYVWSSMIPSFLISAPEVLAVANHFLSFAACISENKNYLSFLTENPWVGAPVNSIKALLILPTSVASYEPCIFAQAF